MKDINRRQLLKSAAGAGAAVAAGQWFGSAALAAGPPKQRIKIGQIPKSPDKFADLAAGWSGRRFW